MNLNDVATDMDILTPEEAIAKYVDICAKFSKNETTKNADHQGDNSVWFMLYDDSEISLEDVLFLAEFFGTYDVEIKTIDDGEDVETFVVFWLDRGENRS